jgi:inner membrane protein involved in colicin E2 resistance
MTELSFEQSQASMRPHEDPVSLSKILLISSLALATLVPTFFVSGLIAEREARQGVVQSEFTRNWGPPQELRSPTLVVPYQSAPDRPCGYLKITPIVSA